MTDWERDFWRDGYVVAPTAFEPDELSSLRPACERLLRGDAWAILGASQRSPQLFAFARHERFRELSSGLVGPDVDLYWDSLNCKRAGCGKEFAWHQDAAYGRTEPDTCVSFFTALDAADERSGGLWVIPGSHRGGFVAHEARSGSEQVYRGLVACGVGETGAVAVPLDAGGVALLHSLTLHRTGPNASDRDRMLYIAAYVRAGTRYRDAGLASDAKAPAFRSGGD